METRPLVVVGGGPAGMAAAVEAARAGLEVILVDDAPELGGQIYRLPPPGIQGGARDSAGDDLRGEVASTPGIEVRHGTTVLGVWEGRELLCERGGETAMLRGERVVLAPGAFDRSVPFPGWTLPGVMTAGGAQSMVKTFGIRPGERALVVGTGPLLMVVANELHKGDVEVLGLLEAGRPQLRPDALLKVFGELGLLRDAMNHAVKLRAAGIPIRFNHTIFSAEGDEGVDRVTYGPVDPKTWAPRRDQATTVEVDLVVAGFGFVPNTELCVLAGCEHHFDTDIGGWVPSRDEHGETSVQGVFSAGDGAGVAGALVATAEGRMAGIRAAEQAGALSPRAAAKRRKAPERRLRSLGKVRSLLDEMSRLRPGLLELAAGDTLVCRCEEVSLDEVRAGLDEGAGDVQALKLLTRLGMGACQGRTCGPIAVDLLCAAGAAPEEAGRVNPRPLTRPASLAALAALKGAP